MHRISVNHCLNYLAASRGKTFVDVGDPSLLREQRLQICSQAEINVQASIDRKRINLTLASMAESLRAPLVLRDAGGYSYQEIADHLGIGLSAAKMRIKRGREKFRQHWQEALN